MKTSSSVLTLIFISTFLVPCCWTQEVTCPGVRITDKQDVQSFTSSYPNCQVMNGNLDIFCTQGAGAINGEIDSLAFLASLTTVKGWVRIQDCRSLQTLNGLSSLQSIFGGPVSSTSLQRGLYIRNNDALTDLKELEGLVSIDVGGVNIRFNSVLCYTDLFAWERVVTGADTSISSLIVLDPPSATCLAKSCDETCTCGFCGGPGVCTSTQSQCSNDNIAWVAAPILIVAILVACAIAYVVLLCKRDDCVCDCYCSLRPAPEAVSSTAVILKNQHQRKSSPDTVIPLADNDALERDDDDDNGDAAFMMKQHDIPQPTSQPITVKPPSEHQQQQPSTIQIPKLQTPVLQVASSSSSTTAAPSLQPSLPRKVSFSSSVDNMDSQADPRTAELEATTEI